MAWRRSDAEPEAPTDLSVCVYVFSNAGIYQLSGRDDFVVRSFCDNVVGDPRSNRNTECSAVSTKVRRPQGPEACYSTSCSAVEEEQLRWSWSCVWLFSELEMPRSGLHSRRPRTESHCYRSTTSRGGEHEVQVTLHKSVYRSSVRALLYVPPARVCIRKDGQAEHVHRQDGKNHRKHGHDSRTEGVIPLQYRLSISIPQSFSCVPPRDSQSRQAIERPRVVLRSVCVQCICRDLLVRPVAESLPVFKVRYVLIGILGIWFRSQVRDGISAGCLCLLFPQRMDTPERRILGRFIITLNTSRRMTALAPLISLFPILFNQPSNPGSFHSTILPLQKKRMICGDEPNEQNMIVARPFSLMCDTVSIPDPVASTYPQRFGLRMLKDVAGSPFGDKFICRPCNGAEAMKNTA